jgi:hypothetical protein
MKTFAYKQSLREHMFIHLNIKPYQCSVCDKSFQYGSQLHFHKKKHSSTAQIKWPKLTDLLENVRKVKPELMLLTEIVRLPPICTVQTYLLPHPREFFNTLINLE